MVKAVLGTRITIVILFHSPADVQTVCILLCDVIIGVLPSHWAGKTSEIFMRFPSNLVVPTLSLPVRDSIPGVQRGP